MAASQVQTLRLFTALRLYRPVWSGSLLLSIGLNDTGRAFALASLAAGSASLLLEEDATRLREATREGCATFTVTTLDEALRALKNELRQGRAITVALGGSSEKWLEEMVERGVLPQAIVAARELSPLELAPITALRHWGAGTLHGFGLSAQGGTDLQALLVAACGGSWRIEEDTADSLMERRTKDAARLIACEGDDPICKANRQWLRAAPSLFPRALNRASWISQVAAQPEAAS